MDTLSPIKKYFKITNATENHGGFQYINGLNILNTPFVEKGTCVGGGLYFTNVDYILGYLSYGIYLREITIPESDPDFKMIKDPAGDKWRANKIILGPRRNLSEVSTFQYLISLGAKMENYYIAVMNFGCRHRNIDIINFLIEKVGSQAENNYGIRYASKKGLLEIVKFLVEKGADIKTKNNYAVRHASRKGRLEVVKFLIEKGADFRAKKDYAVCLASAYGHAEVVKLLINKGAKFKVDNDHHLRLAYRNY